jgi:phage tail-like protein
MHTRQAVLAVAFGFVVCAQAPAAFAQGGIRVFGDLLSFRSTDQGILLARQMTVANRFTVELNGVVVPGMRAVEGIESETEVVEYQDGDDMVTHTRPGVHKPGRALLTRDYSRTSELAKWMRRVAAGAIEKKPLSITFFDDAGGVVMRLHLGGCAPTKYTGPINPRYWFFFETLDIVCDRTELE